MRILFILLMGLAFIADAAGQSDPRAIFEEYERRQSSIKSESATIRMDIISPRGSVRTRSLNAYSLVGADGRHRSMIVFTEPADIRGTGLLTLETASGDDQRLYLPAVGRVQRIAGSSRAERFAGSDFTYEDLGTRNPDDFDLRLMEETPRRWKLEAIPRDPGSQYARIIFSIDRERYALTRAEYFDSRSSLWKELVANDFSEARPGVWRAGSLTMQDLKENRRTELRFVERKPGAALDENFFSERILMRGGR